MPATLLVMVTPIELSDLAAALGVERGELVSLVGGGGKTTTLFVLGRQLAGTTILTTTTKMGADQSNGYAVLINPTDAQVRCELAKVERVLAWKSADSRRATGVSGETCNRWFGIADNVVVEADGSRKRPFKAPAPHEPVIPTSTTLLVACIGASALGRPIEECCHRPELVAALADCSVGDVLSPTRAAAVLLSSHGSRKDLPKHARFTVAVHRATEASRPAIEELDSLLGDHAPLLAVNETPGV